MAMSIEDLKIKHILTTLEALDKDAVVHNIDDCDILVINPDGTTVQKTWGNIKVSK